LAILEKARLLDVSDSEIEMVVSATKKANEKYNFAINHGKNLAKQMAKKLQSKIPIVLGAEFLAGNVHAIANQINENAKIISCWFLLPELNHHLLEGLANPKTNDKNLAFLFLSSNLYNSKIQKRIQITKEVIKKNNIEVLEFRLESGSEIEQSFTVLVFGSWLSFYLAILNNLDPALIPWVDYFKERLS
jgi:glucose/mannose-6-phosphate isomerase